MKILVTGGAGFVGSAFIRHLLANTDESVVNVDKLTYAGDLASLHSVSDSPAYSFEHVDICDPAEVARVFDQHRPDCVVHLAAESHVDRSIEGPAAFIETNLIGTFTLLEASREYWKTLDAARQASFKFHHVSTDEVYGDLAPADPGFSETTPYNPSSPYAATKAGADHLVRAWHRTYGLPTCITNCSNNYGPFQFPEKLIPLMILNALDGKPLPVYGHGEQIRDWLHVDDHARALYAVLTRGSVGETYNIGARSERANIEVVHRICALLEEMAPDKPAGVKRYEDLITFVTDRPGHDQRYAMDSSKLERTLGWAPQETFETGLRKTVRWYMDNRA